MSAQSPYEMHVERDLKLAVPARFRMPSLEGIGTKQTRSIKRATTVFYDTPDLVLAAWGCLLRYRQSEGWTVKLAELGIAETLDRPEQAFAGRDDEVPPPALELLSAVLRGRAVRPVARMTTVRTRTVIADVESPRLDVVDDRVRTDESGPRAFRQIEIELRDPDGASLRDEVVQRLVRAGAELGDRRTKYGWVLADRTPPPEVPTPHLGPGSLTSDVVRAALASATRMLVAEDARIRSGDEPEAVHQARVAVRRLRSDLRAFRPVLDAEWTDRIRDELDWLGEALGTVRDREVLAERITDAGRKLDAADVTPLIRVLREEIDDGRRELDAGLHSRRYFGLLDELVEAARTPPLAVEDLPAADALRESVDRAWRRLRRSAKTARADGTNEELHQVRIEAKRLRYTSEALAPVFGKRATRLARGANALQDVLGEHHDAVVARDWLREHANVDGTETTFAVGEVSALELVARDEARGKWRAAWKKARRARPTKWK